MLWGLSLGLGGLGFRGLGAGGRRWREGFWELSVIQLVDFRAFRAFWGVGAA